MLKGDASIDPTIKRSVAFLFFLKFTGRLRRLSFPDTSWHQPPGSSTPETPDQWKSSLYAPSRNSPRSPAPPPPADHPSEVSAATAGPVPPPAYIAAGCSFLRLLSLSLCMIGLRIEKYELHHSFEISRVFSSCNQVSSNPISSIAWCIWIAMA